MRTIPDDNLAYPVLISSEDGSSGSGFFARMRGSLFLVTARHVLFDDSGALLAKLINLIAYGADPKDSNKTHFRVALDVLLPARNVLRHIRRDVAVVRLGTIVDDPAGGWQLQQSEGVQLVSMSTSRIVAVNEETVRRHSDVLVSNDVYLFGYPSSIGLKELPQFDYSRPLLRRGIVAGKNDEQQTLILDCPVYYGNSGGPVLEMEQDNLRFHYRICGVVSQYVPYLETWINDKTRHAKVDVSNSGYSVAVSIDPVLELVAGQNAA